MKNTEQVIEFFRKHIETVMKEQNPHTWCEDEKNREILWEIEQEISDFNNEYEGEENYEQDFESQHVDSLSEAEDAVIELNRRMAAKWDFEYPFIDVFNARPDSFGDQLVLGWNVIYILKIDIGAIFVSVTTRGHEIKITIKDELIGKHIQADEDFDLLKDLERQRLMFNLTQKG